VTKWDKLFKSYSLILTLYSWKGLWFTISRSLRKKQSGFKAISKIYYWHKWFVKVFSWEEIYCSHFDLKSYKSNPSGRLTNRDYWNEDKKAFEKTNYTNQSDEGFQIWIFQMHFLFLNIIKFRNPPRQKMFVWIPVRVALSWVNWDTHF